LGTQKALALRDGKLELPRLDYQAGAWEPANLFKIAFLSTSAGQQLKKGLNSVCCKIFKKRF
jgi:hypothetical protein